MSIRNVTTSPLVPPDLTLFMTNIYITATFADFIKKMLVFEKVVDYLKVPCACETRQQVPLHMILVCIQLYNR